MGDVNNNYAQRLQALLAGQQPGAVPATPEEARQAVNKQRADTADYMARHQRSMDLLKATNGREDAAHQRSMDLLKATNGREDAAHQRSMDFLKATNGREDAAHQRSMDLVNATSDRNDAAHKRSIDLVNATNTEHQRKRDFYLREVHETHDYDIRMREQLRKDRELESRLAREQAEDDKQLMQALQNTQIHTRMQHSPHNEARKAARLITDVGCFTCEGTESLVNELLQKRMQTNPVATMPSKWRECVSEAITSHGEMVVGDLARRYGRLRGATLDDYVLTDEPQVHTTFARAIAAQIRHTAVSSGLSYKSKYALEATQQTMNRAMRFFERVTHRGGANFAVVHDEVDTGLPARSITKFRRGGVSWASSAPESFWA